jgi:hypothetical protein
MRRLVLVSALLLMACSQDKPQYLFDGIQFRTDVNAPRSDRRAFVATVRDAGQNLAAAQRAGRFAGTEYCVYRFGSSEIDWTEASAGAPETLALTEAGVLPLQGRCAAR